MSKTQIFELLEVETTNYCNRACWFCLHGQQKIAKKIDMPDWMIDKIITELVDMDWRGELLWFSINEPLMDKRIFEVIQQSSQALPHCRTRINTNGDLLTQDILEKLFDHGLWRLAVSLYDKETETKVKALDLKGKNVEFNHFFLTEKEEGVPKFYHFNSRAGAIPELTATDDHKYRGYDCWRPFRKMALRHDGQLKLCCNDMDGKTFDDGLNEKDKTLLELWYSPEMEHYRTVLKTKGRSTLKTCRDCNFHRDCNGVG